MEAKVRPAGGAEGRVRGMKLSKKDEGRRLEVRESEGGFLLIESIRRVPLGYSKGRWEEERIWLSADEIARLAKFASTPQPEGLEG